MIDPFGRTIDYLRISVTDRCNLRCRYCMPTEGVPWLPPQDILHYEEIAEVARVAASIGVTKIRLTGGEPLVRREIETLVGMLAAIAGVTDLSMTTNALLLARRAAGLAAAGLRRVNVSLDAIDPARFAAITRGGDVCRVLAGIDAARQAGLNPVKLNCVIGPEGKGPDAEEVQAFARREGLEVRFIEQMDLAAGCFTVVHGGRGGNCACCNRLRLTSDGQVRPCLFSDVSFSVRELGAVKAIAGAVSKKPRTGSACSSRLMHAIGG
ncbi:MAG: GTP 3',8-cyclase MoaA [Thermoguttaceae bacterium]